VIEIHGDILYSRDVDQAIQALSKKDRRGEWDEDDSDDFTALTGFRHAVAGKFSSDAWDKGLSFVAGDYWYTYAGDKAEDLFGAAVEQACWHADEWADGLRGDFTAFDLDGTEYWTDGQS
jgi:hypothetical protein